MKNIFRQYKVYFLFLIVGSFSTLLISGQENFNLKKGSIYIVRHAEKAQGNDPVLSEEGYKRSGYLVREFKLKHATLDRIYVTQFRRTQLTADSLRLHFNVDTAHYVADNTGDGLMQSMSKHKGDDNILIIGHSNTIPEIIKKLGIKKVDFSISETDYDNLFIVTYRKGKPTLMRKRFGNPNVASANTPWKKV